MCCLDCWSLTVTNELQYQVNCSVTFSCEDKIKQRGVNYDPRGSFSIACMLPSISAGVTPSSCCPHLWKRENRAAKENLTGNMLALQLVFLSAH